MKKTFAIAAIFLLACAAFSQNTQRQNTKFSFNASEISGKEINDSIFLKNKVTMVNIWGTFCPPCIREMPDLGVLSTAYKGKGFEIVGIVIDAADRTGNTIPKVKLDAERIIQKTGATYTHIIPSKDMLKNVLRNVQAVPTTIFIDSQGKQIGQQYLGAKSAEEWQRIIDNLLASQK